MNSGNPRIGSIRVCHMSILEKDCFWVPDRRYYYQLDLGLLCSVLLVVSAVVIVAILWETR